MIKKCSNNTQIINYIGNNYDKCLYIYMDFMKYNFRNINANFYFQIENGIIIALIMKYYSGIHIYSKNDTLNINEIVNFIEQENPTIICCEKNIAINIFQYLKEYKLESGWVRKLDKLNDLYNEENIIIANNEKDFTDITNLLLEDRDIRDTYNYNDLINQIKERNIEKYGRNYFIKDGNKIIAHAGTGAENTNIAILNYVITNNNYRRKGFASKVLSKICNDIINEGKQVYLINYTEESTKLYDKLGFKKCCEWAKIYKESKERKK